MQGKRRKSAETLALCRWSLVTVSYTHLIGDFSICSNIVLGYHRKKSYCSRGILNWDRIESFSQEVVKLYNIKTESIQAPAASLSGGNQQKVVIGRVLSQDPDIIVAAQPTRGIDIGSIGYIPVSYTHLRNDSCQLNPAIVRVQGKATKEKGFVVKGDLTTIVLVHN